MIEVKKIWVSYGPFIVLKDVSLSVGKGVIVSIIGSNGAGKSTLFKAIAGLIPIQKGSIKIFNRETSHMCAHQIAAFGLVLVPEGREIFPEMSVYDNLIMGSYLPKAKGKRAESLNYVYEMFPILKTRRGQAGGSLSGGEQQMLAIGRALMTIPKIMLLDEPSMGIAPILVKEIFDKLKEINSNGVSVILGEQHVEQALNLCSKAYVIENGSIAIEGTGAELLKNEMLRSSYLGI